MGSFFKLSSLDRWVFLAHRHGSRLTSHRESALDSKRIGLTTRCEPVVGLLVSTVNETKKMAPESKGLTLGRYF